MGPFWLFLFRFRNNRRHGISISKRTLIHSEKRNTQGRGDLRTTTSSNRKPGDRRGRPRWVSRQKFPKRTRILRFSSKLYSAHSVHSAIRSRMNGMIFHSFRKRNSSQKNTNTVYSEYSYSGIVPKNRSLKQKSRAHEDKSIKHIDRYRVKKTFISILQLKYTAQNELRMAGLIAFVFRIFVGLMSVNTTRPPFMCIITQVISKLKSRTFSFSL